MKISRHTIFLTLLLPFLASCIDTGQMESRLEGLEERVAALEDAAGAVNSNAVALYKLLDTNLFIVNVLQEEYAYSLELSDSSVVTVTDGMNAPGIVPLISVDAQGRWMLSVDNGENYSLIEGAVNAFSKDGAAPQIMIDEDCYWMVSIDSGQTWTHIVAPDGAKMSAKGSVQAGISMEFFSDVAYDPSAGLFSLTLKDGRTIAVRVLDTFYIKILGYTPGALFTPGQTRVYDAEVSGVESAFFQTPSGWKATLTETSLSVTAPAVIQDGEYVLKLSYISPEGYFRMTDLVFRVTQELLDYGCDLFNDFANKSPDNILLDFSYAGYAHGEAAPADVYTLGYKVFDVTDYGAVADDGKSDREAFMKCLEAATGAKFTQKTGYLLITKSKADAIIYFPEGEFILHDSSDDYIEDGQSFSNSLQISASNIVIKGAGREKTRIVMKDPNRPTDEEILYSSPSMLVFKHNSGLSKITDVKADAAKGSFSVEVDSASGLSAGDWVCLTMVNNDPACIADELQPYEVEPVMEDIIKNGVQVYDYHQVASISGNTVTFREPLMHDVDLKYNSFTGNSYNWRIDKYPHYENVGIEDISFVGNAEDFVHHGSWEDDGAYKPLTMTRLTNSWVRRVGFTSVSEALSVTRSANVSVYDAVIDGQRGHAAIRSQQSSRVFIGAVKDVSSDKNGKTGQYHGAGVSRQSMGAVLWRNEYGNDSCFESHSTQPRATLIDCCYGGWMKGRQGGDEKQAPNHLADLTIWNYRSMTAATKVFDFWPDASYWWRLLPPVIVGFHGEPTSFDQSQVQIDYSNGTPVTPESLYEAQLMLRLGAVPSWLNELK